MDFSTEQSLGVFFGATETLRYHSALWAACLSMHQIMESCCSVSQHICPLVDTLKLT